ncbi:MAG TPA: MaoC/PaaZ C-terminal domain-containing protein [Anaeromyxobacter sp.]
MKRVSEFAVGDLFTAVREVDPFRSVYYAAASGDFNPIHIDSRIARAAGFQGPILQGMCTFAWAAEACAAYLGDPARLRRLRVRFSRPVQVGDVITIFGRCTAIDGDALRLELAASNQKAEDVLTGVVADAVVKGG